MEVQLNTGSLTQAIADCEIARVINNLTESFRQQAISLVKTFVHNSPTPQNTNDLENQLFENLREQGRQLIQWVFSQLEPELEDMPATVTHRKSSHRRLADKTSRKDILTRFGKISLQRARYRRGRSGRTIFPLEILLSDRKRFHTSSSDSHRQTVRGLW